MASRRLIEGRDEPLVVPSPVLVEVDYWIGELLGNRTRLEFLQDILDGNFLIEDLIAEDYDRIFEIAERYDDTPVGFVDAAVLAVVERLGEPKLATLDRRHFGLLRPRHVEALRLLPD
ncbi:MAG TPA: PIN domain-containing protein [Dehalococcoidia bacterium]|nr:PIN domain-containing protein [Dehalococcoidia bacterium]